MKKRNLKVRKQTLRTLLSSDLVSVSGGAESCPSCSGGSGELNDA